MPYLEKQLRLWKQLQSQGKVGIGVYHTRIEHEEICTIWQGQNVQGNQCSCDPDITFVLHADPSCVYCQANFSLGTS